MRGITFIASHLGYPMDRTPLGGGAMVGLQLARRWARRSGLRLLTIGSGPFPPDAPYARVSASSGELAKLSELEYARFCRSFEAEATEHLLARGKEHPPEETVVVVNDISEGPDLRRLSAAGYPIMSLWHVDVVEFFNRIYLKGIFSPERWTRGYDRLDRLGAAGAIPDLLRLVFEKQRETVYRSGRLVLPSRQMAETVRRCYEHLEKNGMPPLAPRMKTIPWGGWRENVSDEAAAAEAARLREHYQLGPSSKVALTMSRISPEKGIHILLEGFAALESSARARGLDTVLFVCGETAFMRGESYGRRVRRAAEKLKRTRVFFPGYLAPLQKRAYFRLADVFVSPSIHESYGLTIVEAMQEGLPIVASDHYGVDEILNPSYGRIVPYSHASKRASALAAALAELFADGNGLKAMGAAAKTAAAGMDFDAASERVLEEALSMIASKSEGAAV